MRNGAIGEAGVEMRQVVIVGDAPGERTLAGCGGAVNCDGEVHAGASIMKSRREQPGTVLNNMWLVGAVEQRTIIISRAYHSR